MLCKVYLKILLISRSQFSTADLCLIYMYILLALDYFFKSFFFLKSVHNKNVFKLFVNSDLIQCSYKETLIISKLYMFKINTNTHTFEKNKKRCTSESVTSSNTRFHSNLPPLRLNCTGLW